MQSVLCIDPGPEESAAVGIQEGRIIAQHPALRNERLLENISAHEFVVIEGLDAYAAPLGHDTLKTAYFIGAAQHLGAHVIPRRKVKELLLGRSAGVGDKEIRGELIHRLGEVGTAKKKGPLYGISNHLWAALAVGIAWLEMNQPTVRTVTAKEHSETPDRKLKPGWDNRA